MEAKTLITMIMLFAPFNLMATELEAVGDNKITYLLSNLEILAEANYPESKGMSARVLKIQEFGECDGTPSSCPKSKLYISVSSYDEDPEQKLYLLPKKHDWGFISWERLPDTDDPQEFIILKLSAKVPSSTPKKGWWKNKEFIIHANYYSAKIVEH